MLFSCSSNKIRVLLVLILLRSGGENSVLVRDCIKRLSLMRVRNFMFMSCCCQIVDVCFCEQNLVLNTATSQDRC